MAQTKRKRRTKHRGNAAGSIEVRGRTGRKLSPEEQKKVTRQTARERRVAKPPSWRSAGLKAGMMAVLLFALTQAHVLGKNSSPQQALFLAAMAFVLYTPLAYVTDRFVYNRMLQKQKNA
jgi:hypothetical protein